MITVENERTIFFAPTPDPATLQSQDEFTIIISEHGQITGDLCKDTMEVLEHLNTVGVETKALIDFCG